MINSAGPPPYNEAPPAYDAVFSAGNPPGPAATYPAAAPYPAPGPAPTYAATDPAPYAVAASAPSAPPPPPPPPTATALPQPTVYAVRTVPQTDVRSDIASLAEAINGLSHSLGQEESSFKNSAQKVATKYHELSSDLDEWKRTLIEKIDHTHKVYKTQLQRAHQQETERLQKGHEKVKVTLENADKLTHVAGHLRRTGNPRDLQNLKENMTENVETLNALLDMTWDLKRSCAESWRYIRPNIMEDSMVYLMGKLDVKTYEIPDIVRGDGANNTSEASNSAMRLPPNESSSVDNLLVQIASAQIDDRYMLMHTFSSKTYNDKARCHPMDFTVDWMGNIVVADKYNDKVKVFTERGQLIQEITSQYLKSPSGIAMTPEGNIAVSDSQMSDVKVFNSQGDLLFYYQRAMQPAGITFNKEGELLVADTGMKAVLVYDNRNWSQPRQVFRDVTLSEYPTVNRSAMWYPHYVTTDAAGDIFISDRTANSLHVVDKDGNCIHGYGERYVHTNWFNEPYGVTMDKSGNLLVADYGSNTVVTIGGDNTIRAPILNKSHDLKFPTNIEVSSEGKLFVSEYLSGDIKVFGTQEMIDETARDESEELPPAYDALSSLAAPTLPSTPSAPAYTPHEEGSPETCV